MACKTKAYIQILYWFEKVSLIPLYVEYNIMACLDRMHPKYQIFHDCDVQIRMSLNNDMRYIGLEAYVTCSQHLDTRSWI